MSERPQIAPDAIVPSFADILHGQGLPADAVVKDRIKSLVETSLGIFFSEVRPSCICRDVSASKFDEIFPGEGRNEEEAPLKTIYPQADHLVLFALTMGNELGQRIEEYLRSNDFALASMLDTVASLAVENAVALLEGRIAQRLAGEETSTGRGVALNYSPGYCGWHISAQNKVFEYLCPEQIGITLNDSYLMTPLKSATGLIVHGDRTIHDFDIGFRFCRACKDKSCLGRKDRLSSVDHSTS